MPGGGVPPAAVLSRLGSGPDGLSSADAAERLRTYGPNALGTHRVRGTAVLARQVRNPILVLLLGAALVSGLTGGGTNALIIAVIVALSVGLGFFNEYRAEAAMAALRGQIRQEAEVRRDGRKSRIPVTDLVPGDVVSLRIGALVPADLRLLKADELECDEGLLTGESMPVAKSAAPVAGRDPQDQPGCAFMGTIVHEGSGLGVVVLTGTRTAFGQIAAGLTERHSQTAFEAGLSRFSRFLFAVAAVLTAFIFTVNVALSRPLIDALLFSLAIAVGIAPEMMPAIVTVSLSAGSKALAAKRVLVKRLVAIENLGNIEILFTDKTGTITEGMITFEHALDTSGRGSGRPLQLGLVCNEATVTGGQPVGGNALDQALWSASGAAAADGAATWAGACHRLGILRSYRSAARAPSTAYSSPDWSLSCWHPCDGGGHAGCRRRQRRGRCCPGRSRRRRAWPGSGFRPDVRCTGRAEFPPVPRRRYGLGLGAVACLAAAVIGVLALGRMPPAERHARRPRELDWAAYQRAHESQA